MFKRTTHIFSVFLILTVVVHHNGYPQNFTRNATEKLIAKVDMKKMVDPSFSISHNLRRISYRIRSGNKQRLVIDGMEQPILDSVSTAIFNNDGSSYAYFGRSGSKW